MNEQEAKDKLNEIYNLNQERQRIREAIEVAESEIGAAKKALKKVLKSESLAQLVVKTDVKQFVHLPEHRKTAIDKGVELKEVERKIDALRRELLGFSVTQVSS